jgi:hypothetical protein
MKRPQTIIATLAVVAATAALALSACTNGLSTQDAYRACESLGEAEPTSQSFGACVACFEDCDDCQPQGTAPETYACPDDSTTGTASSSSGATSSSSSGGG